MNKKLLKNETEWEPFVKTFHRYDGFCAWDKPKEYPCLVVWECVDNPGCSTDDCIQEFIYTKDFESFIPTNNWAILEYADWTNCKEYASIGKKMAKVFSADKLNEVRTFYSALLVELGTLLDDHAENMTGKRHGYYGLSDDRFWDLRAHIIGLGETFYLSVFNDPEIAKRMADNSDFKENFGYIFHYMDLEND